MHDVAGWPETGTVKREVIFTALGSTGDVNPMLAIAGELSRQGRRDLYPCTNLARDTRLSLDEGVMNGCD